MYRVRTVFTGVPGTPWYSNLFFDDQATGGAQAAVDAVAAFWDGIDGSMYSQVAWEVEGDVAIISPGTGEIEGIFPVTGASGGGSGTGQPLPWSTQGLVSFRTGSYVGGRELRGRMFIPGLVTGESSAGAPGTSILGVMNSLADDLLNDPDAELVVYSRKNLIQSPVISAAAAPYWAVLRSRRD